MKALFNTTAPWLLLPGLMLSGPAAWGLIEREQFELNVSIPTRDFYVLPVDPQLVQREQPLVYNTVTSELRPLRANFDVKNISGSIWARLGERAYLSNGVEHIDLRVTFNGHVLALDRTEVVGVSEARPGKRVALEIAAIKPPGDYHPGNYYGTVHLVFDAVAP